MAITFHLSPYLAALVGGQDSVLVGDVNRTVGEALTSLWNSYPILHDRVWMSRKKIRPRINIFVGNEPIRFTGGLLTKIDNRANISILPRLG